MASGTVSPILAGKLSFRNAGCNLFRYCLDLLIGSLCPALIPAGSLSRGDVPACLSRIRGRQAPRTNPNRLRMIRVCSDFRRQPGSCGGNVRPRPHHLVSPRRPHSAPEEDLRCGLEGLSDCQPCQMRGHDQQTTCAGAYFVFNGSIA